MPEDGLQDFCLCVTTHVHYRAAKPLSGPHLVRMAMVTGSAARTLGLEGLENKAKVVFDPEIYNDHAHHHDARYERCRPCYQAANDGLGPNE